MQIFSTLTNNPSQLEVAQEVIAPRQAIAITPSHLLIAKDPVALLSPVDTLYPSLNHQGDRPKRYVHC